MLTLPDCAHVFIELRICLDVIPNRRRINRIWRYWDWVDQKLASAFHRIPIFRCHRCTRRRLGIGSVVVKLYVTVVGGVVVRVVVVGQVLFGFFGQQIVFQRPSWTEKMFTFKRDWFFQLLFNNSGFLVDTQKMFSEFFYVYCWMSACYFKISEQEEFTLMSCGNWRIFFILKCDFHVFSWKLSAIAIYVIVRSKF